MIKTAVYAYWAKAFLEKESYSNFERKNDLLVSLKLSVEQSRKFFDKIIFYGDHEAIAQICNVVKFDEVYDDVEEFLGICAADIAMIHGEINGAMMQPGHFQGGGTPTGWFKRFEQVYSGHYHHKSELNNIRFLGSQMEFTWNDFGDTKHFHILDTETREIEPVHNPLKMFHKEISF